MNQEPQQIAPEGADRDGLAAVAIGIITVALIAFAVILVISR